MTDLKDFEEKVDKEIEERTKLLNLWNMIISSYLSMVLKAKG